MASLVDGVGRGTDILGSIAEEETGRRSSSEENQLHS